MILKHLLLLSLVAIFGVHQSNGQSKQPDDIIGTWMTSGDKAKIQIYKQGTKYYGKIVWAKGVSPDGPPKLDTKNPDPKKRTNPILGLVILKDFVFDDGEWNDGEVYDASSGKTYSCKINLPNKNTLRVRGYIGISLIGRTDVWKRV